METYRGEEEDCNASAILIKKQGFGVIITLNLSENRRCMHRLYDPILKTKI